MAANKHINSIKQVWEEIITSDDYDYHMNMVGQTKPLAMVWMKMLQKFPPKQAGCFLIAGGGTGNFLDFIDIDWIKSIHFKFIITDVSKNQLKKAQERINKYNLHNLFSIKIHNLLVDKPVKDTTSASLSLVLEHLEDWKGALVRLVSGNINTLYIQIQTYDQKNVQNLVTQQTQLRPSMKQFVNLVKEGKISPQRIELKTLNNLLFSQGFNLLFQDNWSVPNSKIMTSLVFRRIK